MERLGKKKTTEINGNALRTWGLLFLAAGVIGRGIIQTHILGIGQVSTAQLLEIMSSSETAMNMVTVSLLLQAMETCAAPIFALMLVEGVEHTSDFMAYFLRVAGLAVLCEIPYNLAFSGSFFALSSRNPVFGLVLCMVMVFFFRRYAEKGFRNTLIKGIVIVAAVLWCWMLKIDFGACLVVITAALWPFRNKPLYRNITGATASIVCSMFSVFFVASPMAFLAMHFYNGEKSTNSRKINYLAYPAMLLIAGVIGMVL